jgi:hypothetical protein
MQLCSAETYNIRPVVYHILQLQQFLKVNISLHKQARAHIQVDTVCKYTVQGEPRLGHAVGYLF